MPKVKLLLSDVDGILTDGGVFISEDGKASKRFNYFDIMGASIARKAGLKIILVTGEKTPINQALAEKLGAVEVHEGIRDKLGVLEGIKEKYSVSESEIAYIGDDVNDIKLLEAVGTSATVPHALPEVKEVCKYVTKREAGAGAFREFVHFLLEA